jgi:uncharacterized protein (DUF433 family)
MKTTNVLRDPEIIGGVPCFHGAGVPFQNLLDYLGAGDTLDHFLDQLPETRSDVRLWLMA